MRIFFAVCLLVIGLGTALILNGQTFTNSLIGVACACAAAALAIGPVLAQGTSRTRGWGSKLVFGLALLLVICLAVQLPSAYRFQSNFNRKVKALHRPAGPGNAQDPAGVPRVARPM